MAMEILKGDSMDHAMHGLWLRAENRIDRALAGFAVCASWLICCVVTVILTDVQWSAAVTALALISLPIAVVFIRPLYVGIQVAQAIEQRDADELARWRETGVPLRYPELLRARLLRIHYPLLIVVAIAGTYSAILGIFRALTASGWATVTYSWGFFCVGIGVAAGALVMMRGAQLAPRALLARLVASTWTVPLGAALIAWAMVSGRVEISTGARATYATIVLAIFGVIVGLIAIACAALWCAWLGRVFRGHGLRRKKSRVSPAEQVELDRFAEEKAVHTGRTGEIPLDETYLTTAEWSLQLVGLSPEETETRGVPEFDTDDVAIIQEALRASVQDYLGVAVIIAASCAIVVLTLAGMGGTLVHGAVAAVLLLAMVWVIADARKIRQS